MIIYLSYWLMVGVLLLIPLSWLLSGAHTKH